MFNSVLFAIILIASGVCDLKCAVVVAEPSESAVIRPVRYTSDFVFPGSTPPNKEQPPVEVQKNTAKADQQSSSRQAFAQTQCTNSKRTPGEETARLLLLRKSHDSIDNAVDYVRAIIVDSLDLPHLEYKILQAKLLDKDILFELATLEQAHEVLQQYHQLRKDQHFAANLRNIEIRQTNRNFFDRMLDVRSF